jgi:hypothetical protein
LTARGSSSKKGWPIVEDVSEAPREVGPLPPIDCAERAVHGGLQDDAWQVERFEPLEREQAREHHCALRRDDNGPLEVVARRRHELDGVQQHGLDLGSLKRQAYLGIVAQVVQAANGTDHRAALVVVVMLVSSDLQTPKSPC